MLIKPTTGMNNSGAIINEVLNFYKLKKENLVIVFDDVDLPLGEIRFRIDGGDGCHKGMKSILKYISNDKIIGVSCYNNFNLAKDAVRYDIDYVSFGAYMQSLTKQNAKKMNKKELKEVSNFSLLPKTIIGGINLSNIDDYELKNFEMIAASKGIMECNDLDKLFMLAKK